MLACSRLMIQEKFQTLSRQGQHVLIDLLAAVMAVKSSFSFAGISGFDPATQTQILDSVPADLSLDNCNTVIFLQDQTGVGHSVPFTEPADINLVNSWADSCR